MLFLFFNKLNNLMKHAIEPFLLSKHKIYQFKTNNYFLKHLL